MQTRGRGGGRHLLRDSDSVLLRTQEKYHVRKCQYSALVYSAHSLTYELFAFSQRVATNPHVFSVIANSLTKILSLASSYDLRRADGSGGDVDHHLRSPEHWSDHHVFGPRARFDYASPSSKPSRREQTGQSISLELAPDKSPETPPQSISVLEILSVATGDAGIYRCRVDFERAPTRNSMTNLTVVGKTGLETTRFLAKRGSAACYPPL